MPDDSIQDDPDLGDQGEAENDISGIMAALKSQRNFEFMPEGMLQKLLRVMNVVHYGHGSVIMNQGEKFPYTCIVLKGHVAIFVDGKHIINLRRTGDIIGEMSFVNEGPCSATVKAETECDIIQISKETLTQIGDTEFYVWLCRVLSDKLRRTSEVLSKQNQNRV